MMKRTGRALLAVVGVCLLAASATAFACMCAPPRPANNMRERAAAYHDAAKVIFEGRVEKQGVREGSVGPPEGTLSMTPAGQYRVVTIRSLRVYRGPEQQVFTVITGMGTGDCGFDFETGKDYLVYADPMNDGRFFTSICVGTDVLEHAGPALRLLRGEPAAPEDLIDIRTYYERFVPKWTGMLCGRVTTADDKPLGKASVDMMQLREGPLPPNLASDRNNSKADGSFCVTDIPPGRYLLTSEEYDYSEGTRWMGFYPGVTKHAEAVPIEIKTGDKLSGYDFKVQKQAVYTVRFRVVTPDGGPVPWKNLGIYIKSPDRDALAYNESHGIEEDGSYALGLIPPGRYVVGTYVEPDFDTGQPRVPKEMSKWRMAKQEVDITAQMEVVLKLLPAH